MCAKVVKKTTTSRLTITNKTQPKSIFQKEPVNQFKTEKNELKEELSVDEMKNGKANVFVCVRVRPESNSEILSKNRKKPTIKVINEHVLVFDPSDDTTNLSVRQRLQIGERRGKDMKFAFDRVFDEQSSQVEVYENTTKFLLPGVLNGYNATVFANGATGSGKTYTMIGNERGGPGVLVLTVQELFSLLEKSKNEKQFKITVSYLEIYNEQIRDLLVDNSHPLELREDKEKGAIIAGLSTYNPTSVHEVLDYLKKGNKRRVQYETAVNSESSRSHAVFQIQIESMDRTGNVKSNVKIGKLSLIDLAGSERAAKTKNIGARLVEGANINKSLLALGSCINALAKAEGKSEVYVPYRGSKLTRILKDSLGGNCRTVMIATVSPSSVCYEDTLNSLNYCERAKSIKTNIKTNVVSVDWHLSKYNKIIDDLRAEIAELKKKSKDNDVPKEVNTEKIANEKKRKELLIHFQEQIKIRKQIMENEEKSRRNELEIMKKQLEIKKWEIDHPNQSYPILIMTLRDDMSLLSKLSQEVELSNKKLEEVLKESIQKCKLLQEKLTWEYIESDVRYHEQVVLTLDWERQVQFYKVKDLKSLIMKEEYELEILKYKKILFENQPVNDFKIDDFNCKMDEEKVNISPKQTVKIVPKIEGYREKRVRLLFEKQKNIQEQPSKKVQFSEPDKMDLVEKIPNYKTPTISSSLNKEQRKIYTVKRSSFINKENARLSILVKKPKEK